jgi:hypothetical protein
MTTKDVQTRNARSEWLRTLQTEDGTFYVEESSEGKILYKVLLDGSATCCTCSDFTRNSKKDPDFRCKHILSAMNCIPIGQVEAARFLDRKKPKLDERWIMEIEGNQFVKFAGLLDLGHQKGISQIEVETVQLPTKDNGNFAICKATVVSKTGESFQDLGDAHPGNCTSKVVKHLLRLASTRAIARALRTYTNIGMTCLEELADISDVTGNGDNAGTKPKASKQPGKQPEKKAASDQSGGKKASQGKKATGTEPGNGGTSATEAPQATGGNGGTGSNSQSAGSQPGMSEAQKRAIYNLSRRRGISAENLEQMSLETFGLEVENLTSKDASAFIRQLQQAA